MPCQNPFKKPVSPERLVCGFPLDVETLVSELVAAAPASDLCGLRRHQGVIQDVSTSIDCGSWWNSEVRVA
jgi:hypothetical protein